MYINNQKAYQRFAERVFPILEESREYIDAELRRRATNPVEKIKSENDIYKLIDVIPSIFRFCAFEHLLLAEEPTHPVNLICTEFATLDSKQFIYKSREALQFGKNDEDILQEFKEFTSSPPNSRLEILTSVVTKLGLLDLLYKCEADGVRDLFTKSLAGHCFAFKTWLELPGADNEFIPQIERALSKAIINIKNSSALSGMPSALDQHLNNLNKLIGLAAVKEQIRKTINFHKLSRSRQLANLPPLAVSKHLVFTGNPGTGKTTVARMVANIYKELGVVSKGHMIETDRSGLVADYLGQTATKTTAVVMSALGGILFIDEAYSLVSEHNDSYGVEAVDTLLKLMEDHRNDLVVIVAGYTELMNKFISSNPGLKSRFNQFIHFEDYTKWELLDIFSSMAQEAEININNEAFLSLEKLFSLLILQKNDQFGNGRLVRNVFEQCLMNQAMRLSKYDSPTRSQLTLLVESDIKY